jgi:diguanylate cyclase (GGDEF)-like protein
MTTLMQLATPLKRWRHRLTVHIIVLGVAMVLMGGVARYIVTSVMLTDGLLTTVGAQHLSLANYVAKDIDGKIGTRQKLLEQVAQDLPLALMQQPEPLQAWLEQRHRLAPFFSLGLVVVAADGKSAIADYPVLGGRRALDFNDRDWFIAARDTGRFAIGKPTIGRAAFQGVVHMAVPVKDSNGQVAAVLMGVTALNMPGFLDNIESHKIGSTGSLLLFSPRDEIIVTSTEPQLRLQPTPRPGANRLHDQAMEGWRGHGVTVNAFGVETVAAFASVPRANWVVVARMPTDEVLSAATALMRANLRSSVVSAAVLIVVLIVLLSYLMRPLKNSAQHMRAMADGHAPLSMLPAVQQDEVGEMVESFNALVMKLQDSEIQMVQLAHNDPLTGLPNRRSFMTHLPKMVALAERQCSRLAVLFIDLDGFKQVNDSHGHQVGDKLLQQVAARLSQEVRKSDLVGRIGGDEFMLLLTDCHDQESIAAFARKIIDKISQPYTADGVEMNIGASIGIALFPEHAIDVEALITLADAAMYEVKRSGRNGFRFAAPRSGAEGLSTLPDRV